MNAFYVLSDLIKTLKEKNICTEEVPNIYDKPFEEIKINILKEGELERLVTFLKAISDKNKLKILSIIKDYPLPVCVISIVTGLDQTLVSHHLRLLKELGLVEVISVGRFRFYKANGKNINKYVDQLKKIFGFSSFHSD